MIYGFYILLIVLLNVLPLGSGGVDRFDVGPLRADYFLHVLAFLPWMILFSLLMDRKRRPVPKADRIVWAILWMWLGLVLAVVLEGVQLWLPYRSFNPVDTLCNMLGVAAGALIRLFWPRCDSR